MPADEHPRLAGRARDRRAGAATLMGMFYGEVLAVNYPGCAHLEPTPDRWGRSGVRASRLWRAPGAGNSRSDSETWGGAL